MNTRVSRLVLILLLIPIFVFSQTEEKSALVERVDTTAFIQLEANSFKDLSPKQKQLAYWLQQASIAIDPIIYDQLSKNGLRQKRLLEEIAAHPGGTGSEIMDKITAFAKLFWANRGNHNEITSQKFLPAFTFEELQAAAGNALKHGAFRTAYADLPPIRTQQELDKELYVLKPSLFDPQFEIMMTAKSPQGGKDILQSSANSFYSNVTLEDVKDFQ